MSAGGEDRYIRVWHNAPGMKELLVDLEGKLPKATSEPQKVMIFVLWYLLKCVFNY